ncbi:hypothetical protein AGMMS49982_18140 [Bacteroidia bacterium]|nr:hypothetical protein AGMMS49982_18140 [Bacteroidia bacterium]
MKKRNLLGFCATAALLLSAVMVPQQAQAGPAYPHPIRYQQPDGSIVALTLQGDEHAHWAASEDGYTLLSDSHPIHNRLVETTGNATEASPKMGSHFHCRLL